MEAGRLDAHLWKEKDQHPHLIEMRNLCVHCTLDGMQVMAALKARSRADIAFWHIYISPRRSLTPAEATKVVDLAVDELRAHRHPLMILAHGEKPRARMGGGANHLHCVLGHVSPVDFRALDMRHHGPRLHKAMAVAAYMTGSEAVAGHWHESIVEALRTDGKGHVADWLIDTLGAVPVIRPPRMSDSMRRSAQAAGFPLARFQAGLERLWKSGGTEPDISLFLSGHGVAIVRGNSVGIFALYHKKLFVGALDRILRQDSSLVHAEAQRRIPQLLACAESRVSDDTPSPSSPELWKLSDVGRNDSLKLQRRVDVIEEQLASLRTERLSLIYQPSQASSRKEESQDNIVDRINRLVRAESVLEIAVSLLWQDLAWATKSEVELMQAAVKIVDSAPDDPAREGFGTEIEPREETDEPSAPDWSP